MKIFIYESHGRPYPFATLAAAKAFAEEHKCVTPDENPQWYVCDSQHRLSVHWRCELLVVWECEVSI